MFLQISFSSPLLIRLYLFSFNFTLEEIGLDAQAEWDPLRSRASLLLYAFRTHLSSLNFSYLDG